MKAKLYPVAVGVVLALVSACTEKTKSPESAANEAATKAPEGPDSHEREGDHADDEHVDEEGGHAEPIRLTPAAAANAQLAYGTAESRTIGSSLSVPARVEFTQQGHARVSSRVSGRVVELRAIAGTQVKKDGVLALLDSPQLGEARARYLAAAAKARVAQSNYQREKALFEKGISPERDLREAEATLVSANAEMNSAEAALHALGLEDAQIRRLKADEHYGSRFPVVSPITGTVVEVAAAVGQSVEPTTPLFTVGDLSNLWVVLDVSESQLAQVAPEMPVEISVASRPGKIFTGTVDYVGDLVDPKTRTVPVRVVVPNPDGQLKPGMFATAQLSAAPDAGSMSKTIVVPREAVQKVGDEEVVFVPAGPNQFRAVEVSTGKTTATQIEIVSGLDAGTQVVTGGAFILKSELSKESMGEGHAH